MTDMALIDGIPGEGSIISFTPDTRFATVHYEGYRGHDLVVTLELPFIGWALITGHNDRDPRAYWTKLVAVGLDDTGQPVLPLDIAANFSLDEGKVFQTRLVAVGGSEVSGRANPGWGGIPTAPLAGSGSRRARHVPTNEVVDCEPGAED
jgi:hypothetical protein